MYDQTKFEASEANGRSYQYKFAKRDGIEEWEQDRKIFNVCTQLIITLI